MALVYSHHIIKTDKRKHDKVLCILTLGIKWVSSSLHCACLCIFEKVHLLFRDRVLGSISTHFRQQKYSLPCFKCKHSFLYHLLRDHRSSETSLILSFLLSLISLPNIFSLQIILTKTVFCHSPMLCYMAMPV